MASRPKPSVLYERPIPDVQTRPDLPVEFDAEFPVKSILLLIVLSVAVVGTTAGRWYGWAWGLAATFLAVGIISVVLGLFACLASGLVRTD
jgi:hypothetical protein